MTALLFQKWPCEPQRLLVTVVLLGMLFFAPQQCQGQKSADPSQTAADPPQAVAQAEPEPGSDPSPAGKSSAPPNHTPIANKKPSAVARQFSGRARGNGGQCAQCYGENCMDPMIAEKEVYGCFNTDDPLDKDICFTFSVTNKEKNETTEYQKDCWSSKQRNCFADILSMKNKELLDYKKICVKGKYTKTALECAIRCDRDCVYFKRNAMILEKKEKSPPPTLPPPPKRNDVTTTTSKPGYGINGEDFYEEATLCVCTGKGCNSGVTLNDLKKAVQVSSGPILQSCGLTSMITFTLIVATAGLLRLP